MRFATAVRSFVATTLVATGVVVAGSTGPAAAAVSDTFLQEWTTGTQVTGLDLRGSTVYMSLGSQVRRYTEFGSLLATISAPGSVRDVAVDSAGNTYLLIADQVWKYDGNGDVVTRWGRTGTADGEFDTPQGIATAPDGGVFVADTNNDRLQKFTAAGVHLATLTTFGPGGAESFDSPYGVDVDTLGNVYVSDLGNERVLRFNSTAGLTLTVPISNASLIDIAVQGAGTNAVIMALDFAPAVGTVRYYDANGASMTGLPRDLGSGLGKWANVSAIAAGTDNFYIGAAEQLGLQKVMRFGDPDPDLTVVKAATQASVFAGQAIDYTITVTNTGNQTLTGLTIADANAPNCAGAAVPPTLAPEAQFVRNCSYTTSLANIPNRSNVASADTAQTNPENSNTVNTPVNQPPSAVGGTVTETGTGEPVAGAFVAVLDSSTFSMAGGAVAEGDGDYFVEVDPGSYYLYLIDSTGDHSAGFHGPPTLVSVSNGATTTADPMMAPTRGTISGTLTDSVTGEPLNQGWAVTLDGNTGRPGPADETSFLGHYEIPDLPAGNHLVVFLHKDGTHQPEFFDNSPSPAGAAVVTVTPGGTATANASLAPLTPPGTGSMLSGFVTQEGTGDPIEGAWVVALNAATYGIVKADITGQTGVYAMPVPAGDYKLEFIDPTGDHLMEWHDDHPFSGIGDADTVNVPPGVNAAVHADLLPYAGSFSGTVTDQATTNPINGAWVIAIGPTGIDGGGVTGPSGTYQVMGLPPVPHRATFVDPNGGHVQEYWNNSPDYNGSTAFAITSGGVMPGINAALANAP